MKAIVIGRFGSPDVLELVSDYPRPKLQSNQVLIQVHVAGINPIDCKAREGQLRLLEGSKFPLILGNDASGVVVETGSSVTKFKAGDEVFGFLDSYPKPSWKGFAKSGAYAEFAATREDTLALKPANMSHIEAASVPLAALTAYQVFRKTGVKAGMKMLINGASGGVGIFAVQLAKHVGCSVTALCSERNHDMVIGLGADHVIDYKKHPIASIQGSYDYIYDVAATTSYLQCRHLLSRTGIFVTNANLTAPFNMLTTWTLPLLSLIGVKQRTDFAWVKSSGKDLEAIAKIIDEGDVKTVIDRIFAMDNASAAHEHSESGRVQGKIIIDIRQGS